MSVKCGAAYICVGPEGCGKTTALNKIFGVNPTPRDELKLPKQGVTAVFVELNENASPKDCDLAIETAQRFDQVHLMLFLPFLQGLVGGVPSCLRIYSDLRKRLKEPGEYIFLTKSNVAESDFPRSWRNEFLTFDLGQLKAQWIEEKKQIVLRDTFPLLAPPLTTLDFGYGARCNDGGSWHLDQKDVLHEVGQRWTNCRMKGGLHPLLCMYGHAESSTTRRIAKQALSAIFSGHRDEPGYFKLNSRGELDWEPGEMGPECTQASSIGTNTIRSLWNVIGRPLQHFALWLVGSAAIVSTLYFLSRCSNDARSLTKRIDVEV